MKKDFTGRTTTAQGHEIKDVKFLTVPGLWGGKVKDPQSPLPDKWVSILWTKSGKCPNRPEFNL